MHHILVVDDEEDIRHLICDILQEAGFKVTTVSKASDAIELVKRTEFTVVISDVCLGEEDWIDGLGLLEQLRVCAPTLPVIMISGHGTTEFAVNSIKMGACDWIDKPFTEERLVLTVRRAIELNKLNLENAHFKKRSALTMKMIGHSPAINLLKANIEKLAATNSRVLITGPSGSGKELAARYLHKKSAKVNEPFVIYRAYRSHKSDIMIDLFGSDIRSGLLARISNGILYIDELANLSQPAQSVLLKLLQKQQIDGVDYNRISNNDFRVISSTKYSGEELMATGFNEVLYQRLKVSTLKVPSLAEHKEDISALAEYFIEQISQVTGIMPLPLADDAIQHLQLQTWVGNVRELRLVVEYMVIQADQKRADKIDSRFLPIYIAQNNMARTGLEVDQELISMSLREAREMFEKKYLQLQIERSNGSISRTAEIIGMERSALHRKLKTLGIVTNRGQVLEEDFSEVEKV